MSQGEIHDASVPDEHGNWSSGPNLSPEAIREAGAGQNVPQTGSSQPGASAPEEPNVQPPSRAEMAALERWRGKGRFGRAVLILTRPFAFRGFRASRAAKKLKQVSQKATMRDAAQGLRLAAASRGGLKGLRYGLEASARNRGSGLVDRTVRRGRTAVERAANRAYNTAVSAEAARLATSRARRTRLGYRIIIAAAAASQEQK